MKLKICFSSLSKITSAQNAPCYFLFRYKVMQRCWDSDRFKRPTPDQLMVDIENMLTAPSNRVSEKNYTSCVIFLSNQMRVSLECKNYNHHFYSFNLCCFSSPKVLSKCVLWSKNSHTGIYFLATQRRRN